MSFEYDWSRDDLRKELRKKRRTSNITLFIISIVIYLYIMYNGIVSKLFDNSKIYVGIFVFCVVIIIFLTIFNEIYVCFSLLKNDKKTNKAYGKYKVLLDENKIRVNIKDEVIEYNYVDIKKIKFTKNIIYMNTEEDKIGLLFKRYVIGDENFSKLNNFLKEKIGG